VLSLDQTLGMTSGHDDTVAFVASLIDWVEPRPTARLDTDSEDP
jgi:hypothetical protein